MKHYKYWIWEDDLSNYSLSHKLAEAAVECGFEEEVVEVEVEVVDGFSVKWEVRSWPHAASMSCPLGHRTGALSQVWGDNNCNCDNNK